MPRRPPHPCAEPGCPALVYGPEPRCPDHAGDPRPALHTTTTSRQERGYGKAWTRARLRALHRDRRTCVVCGAPATEVDHIVPKAEGGSDELENLRSLCHQCHQRATHDQARARLRGDRTPAPEPPPFRVYRHADLSTG